MINLVYIVYDHSVLLSRLLWKVKYIIISSFIHCGIQIIVPIRLINAVEFHVEFYLGNFISS